MRSRKEREILINRKYTDLNIVEIDTVVGLQEEVYCFLTLFWRNMLIFKLESQTTEEVTRKFKILQILIPLAIHKSFLSIILTYNGHEFFDVNNVKCIHSTGEYVTHFSFVFHICLVKKE